MERERRGGAKAVNMFDKMPVRNAVSWNAVIAGYVDNRQPEAGLKLFRRMILSVEVRPNPSTLSSTLLGCSNSSALELGWQIHQVSLKLLLCLDPSVRASLVSMYCKCGELDDAYQMFDGIRLKDVVVWYSMISGYANHGCGKRTV